MYNDVEWVVLDEVDTLLQEGFVEHLDRILQPVLVCCRSPSCQSMCFELLTSEICQGIRQSRKGARPLNFVFVSATVSKEVLRSIQKNFPVRSLMLSATEF